MTKEKEQPDKEEKPSPDKPAHPDHPLHPDHPDHPPHPATPIHMATLNQIRNAVDANLATLYPIVKNKQDAYFLAHGRYFQLRRTHAVTPSEGNTAACNLLSDHPTDQADSWTSLGINPGNISYCLRVDRYVTPAGQHGWVGVVMVWVLSKCYMRARGEGPESRNQAWMEVVPTPAQP